ncbi:MAG TPA: PepSY domain-containing protein [Solirubrobacter sp.]|nr:PepSY domain-containing protein [Solirubrobacter sp.]
MKKIAIIAAATAGLAGVAAFATVANGASSADAVRAVNTASRGISAKPYELDRERTRWEVQFADGTERHVTLNGRRVTSTRRTDDRSTLVASARVSLTSALRTAARRARGTLEDADLERERGRLVWSVNFERSGDRETEVEVDARTGRVVRVTHDD